MKIESGTGNGRWASVDRRNRLEVKAEVFPYQQIVSIEEGESYQVDGIGDIINGTSVILHIANTSSTKNLVINNISHQVLADSDTNFPSVDTYFSIRRGRTRVSGGSLTTAVNTNAGSGNIAPVTAYQGNPTLTGDATIIERWYTKASGDRNLIRNDGALVIIPGQSLEFSYVSDFAGGSVYCNVSFAMLPRT